jgi:predicted permease
MDALWRDLKLAARRLGREPGFAAVALLTLALGIGANTAIFSIIDGALLKPLAYPQPDELVSLHLSIPQFTARYPLIPVGPWIFNKWKERSRDLSALSVIGPTTFDLTGIGKPEQVRAVRVSASIFQVMGVSPRLGRAFLPSEDQPNRNHVVILSDAFWHSHFHADPNILGRTIDLNGQACQIVGVMGPDFRFPRGPEFGPLIATGMPGPIEVFKPAGIDFAKAPPLGNFNEGVFARMRPGVTVEALRTELQGITTAAETAAHTTGQATINVVAQSLRSQMVGGHTLGLWLLLAAVGAILLIVCLNLANLLLVRVHARGHESAIRMALGASRGRLLRETVTEGVLLSLAGGALGIVGAYAAVRMLVAAAPAGIPRLDEIGLNGAVLAFALGLALASGIFFSLAPGLRAAGSDPQRALRAGGRGVGEGRSRGREFLVGAQSALTAALLVVAGLLTASYLRLMNVDKGFQAHHVLTVNAAWPAGNRDQRAAVWHNALAKLRALPGVTTAGLIDVLPTQGTNDVDLISRPGDTRPFAQRPVALYAGVSPDYFQAMGVPLIAGRTFTGAEMQAALGPGAQRSRRTVAAVISADTATLLFGRQNPIGRSFTQADPQPTFQVVGVAGNVRWRGLAVPPEPTVYVPYTYSVPIRVAFTLRTPGSPAALAGGVRAAIWSVQPDAAVPFIRTMGNVVASSVASRRFQMDLVLAFALTALLLAALGIYGVVAYSVARRTQEIGIRITLGAGRGHLYRLVMAQGLIPVVAGLALGVVGALAGGRLLASLLYGVHAGDPAVVALVSLTLLATAALACALPARRAAATDPVQALR